MSSADQTTPAGVRTIWIAAIESRDAPALRPLLADDYEVWANGVEALVGPDVVVAAMAAAIERNRVEQTFEPIETVIAGDWAFERGIERITVTPFDGGPPRTAAQRALLILRRGDDGKWRFARGMTNALPVAPTS
jgi:ketosteroid isomerase-like protein